MSAGWTVVLLVGAGTFALKGLAPALLGGRALPAVPARLVAFLGPTLLAALVVTHTFADGERLVLDGRAAGVGAGAVAIALRAPVLVVVVVAAAGAALARAV